MTVQTVRVTLQVTCDRCGAAEQVEIVGRADIMTKKTALRRKLSQERGWAFRWQMVSWGTQKKTGWDVCSLHPGPIHPDERKWKCKSDNG